MNGAATMAKRAALTSSSSSNGPPWADLPPELTANIFQRLKVRDIFKSAQVCTSWRRVRFYPSIWRVVDLAGPTCRLGDHIDKPKDCDRVCREVVSWSQGQLISIKLGFFLTDDLLLYIAQRAKQLKHLRIWSHYLSDEGFSKAVNGFPLLEKLEVEFTEMISIKSIEAARRSCPFLKSFSLINENNIYLRSHEPYDEEAFAVAKNMHDLKHLALVANDMTDEGVEAILNGCPHLESLDIENCKHVSLEGDLGKRCFQRIKDLKHGYKPLAEVDKFLSQYCFERDKDNLFISFFRD